MSATVTPVVEVVHWIPGRVRLRVPALKAHPELAEQILSAGMAHPGVRRVRVNLQCASVVVEGDPGGSLAFDDQSPVQSLVQHWLASAEQSAKPANRSRSVADGTARGRLLPLALSLGGVALTFVGLGWVRLIAGALTLAGALPIIRRGVLALAAERRLNVDHLDTAALAALMMTGDLRGAGLICALVALGEEIRERTARRSRRAAFDLHATLGRSAWLVRGEEKTRVAVDSLRVQDVVVAYPGDLIPVDGVVVGGAATVDQQLLTGEATPVFRTTGERVFAGTTVADGALYVRSEAIGEATRAGSIVRLLEQAPLHDSRSANYAHQFADRLVAPTFMLAVLSFVLTGSLTRVAAILIVDFATGIRVSAPTTIMATLGRTAREGILIKGGRALESLARADTIVFDKTGTLTRGMPDVLAVVSLSERFAADEVLGLAAAAEQRLRHPTARALVRHAQLRQIALPPHDDFQEQLQYVVGRGVVARVAGHVVRVGSARFIEETDGLSSIGRPSDVASRLQADGASLVYVAVDDLVVGLIAYRDPIRPESASVIRQLRRRGIREILIVTGDEPSTARSLAHTLGVECVHAGVLPDEKAAIVRDLRRQGRVVAVVGDGINDSPALAMADVSVSLSHGADVARETADALLLDSDLNGLVRAIDIARQCSALINQNLLVVGVPNLVALALAAMGRLNPFASTLLNNGSTIVAAMNSLRPLIATNGNAGRR